MAFKAFPPFLLPLRGSSDAFPPNISNEEKEYDVDFQVTPVTMISNTVMADEDIHAYNDFDNPERVVPVEVACENGKKSQFKVKLPAYSFSLIRFKE